MYRSSTMGRWITRASAVVVVAALLTGCRGGDIEVTVRGDGSGVVVAELYPSREVLAQLDAVDLDAIVERTVPSDADVELEEVEVRGRRGYRVEVGFDDHADLPGVLVDGVDVAGRRVQLLSSFDLRELEGEWHLDAVVNPVTAMTGGPASDGLAAQVDAVLRSATALTGRSGIELSIALPGNVVASNADEVDGGTATWDLTGLSAPTRLTMRTEPKELPTGLVLAVGTGAALLVLGIVLWAVGATRRQRGRARRIRPQRAGRKGVEAPAAWGPPPRHAIGFEPAEPGGPSTSDRPHPLPPLTGGGPAEPPPPPPTEPVAPPQPPPAAPVPPLPPPGAPAPPAPPVPPPAPVAPASPVPPPAPEPHPTPHPAPPKPGWYPDPKNPTRVRWWDGTTWTAHFD